jgi:DNA adenine methylase
MKLVKESYLNANLAVLSPSTTSVSIKSKSFSPKIISPLTNTNTLKPFVKWAGGKRQLIQILRTNLPKSYNCYFEPFIGGGALLFGTQTKNAVISDINSELINAYITIRDDVESLICSLNNHKNEEDYFYEVRSLQVSNLNKIERAARFIYLNKTCFNGLYRENSKGQFNSPFGRYKNPNISDQDNLRLVSIYLNSSNIEIYNQDYEETIKKAKRGDFIYFDPPYYPLTSTANFTKYAKGDFTPDNQKELASVFKRLDKKGCFVMLSNSNTDFIKDLYKDYPLIEIEATRFINCKADRRGKGLFEVLIKNY